MNEVKPNRAIRRRGLSPAAIVFWGVGAVVLLTVAVAFAVKVQSPAATPPSAFLVSPSDLRIAEWSVGCKATLDFAYVTVSGVVSNIGDHVVEWARIQLVVGKDGRVIASDFIETDRPIEPRDSEAFSGRVAINGANYDACNAYVTAVR